MLLTIDAEYYFTVICKDSDKLFKDFNFAHRVFNYRSDVCWFVGCSGDLCP